MRVLVTGGAGFIGSNLVWVLIGGGHEVGVIDDLSTGTVANLHPAAWFRRLDVLDDAMPSAVAEFDPEAVVHLAAQASVAASIADPERDRAVNVDGTLRVAEAARAAGAKRMLSASSAAVYGEPAELPLVETSPKAPANPYGASKLQAEAALASALAGTTTDFASLRFSNVYGPRQNASGEGGVIAVFCDDIAGKRAPTIFGDGSQTRDFVYVGDIVNGVLQALEFDGSLGLPGDDGAAYNLSTGEETSLNQLVGLLRATANYLGPVEHADARTGDVARSALDPGKASDTFGWQASASLQSGLAATWRWFSSR